MVASEIARLISLPAARYGLAVDKSTRGVVSETFLEKNAWLALGNTLLDKVVEGYDGTKRFRQREYRLGTVLALLRRMRYLQVPIGTAQEFENLGVEYVFIGYLAFDALIGNTDRHHENWGVVVTGGSDARAHFSLAPTFDHASSLGRNETTDGRARRLTTSDQRDTVEAYAGRARSAFFGPGSAGRPLRQREVMATLNSLSTTKAALSDWAARICSLEFETLREIFDSLPPDWIEESAIEFALRMLTANQRMIHEAANA